MEIRLATVCLKSTYKGWRISAFYNKLNSEGLGQTLTYKTLIVLSPPANPSE